jgi:hypothetical protein
MARRWGAGGLEEGSGGPLASGRDGRWIGCPWCRKDGVLSRSCERTARLPGDAAQEVGEVAVVGIIQGGAVILLRPSGVRRETKEDKVQGGARKMCGAGGPLDLGGSNGVRPGGCVRRSTRVKTSIFLVRNISVQSIVVEPAC